MEIVQHFLSAQLLNLLQIVLNIHTGIGNLASQVQVNIFTMYYIILHLPIGLLGALIHRYIAEGPANPFGGAQVERETFWLIFLTGLVGLAMSLISAGDNLLSKKWKTHPKKQDPEDQSLEEESLSYLVPEMTEETAQELRRFM
jgi:hypothetical protein